MTTTPLQRMAPAIPGPVYVNETQTDQRLAPAVYVNETISTSISLVPGAGTLALTQYATAAEVAVTNTSLVPGKGTLTLAGQAPTVGQTTGGQIKGGTMLMMGV